jgi:SAM-dependent methyltransferase
MYHCNICRTTFVVLFLLDSVRVSVTDAKFVNCSVRTSYGKQIDTHSLSWETHSFTNRSFNDLLETLPTWFVHLISSYNESVEVLEIGCGNGHALLNLQTRLPSSHLVCVNKAGYGHFQAENKSFLLDTALHYGMPLLCDEGTGSLVLPELVLLENGIDKASLPFRNESFDLILSNHALNQGACNVGE